MHSSTSSSRDRAPRQSSLPLLLAASTLALCLLGALEWRLRDLGLRPNVIDSQELWAAQRARASQLGNRALILVGASRIQLGIDLDTLRAATGLEPVQLAIDGSTNLPVLEDLANDESITGTILVSTSALHLIPSERSDRADEWTNFYREQFRGLFSPQLEARLKSLLMEYSALYSSELELGYLPSVIAGRGRFFPYLTFYSDRQRDADYQLVEMPQFYVGRVVRHLGGLDGRDSFKDWEDFNSTIFSAVESLEQRDPSDYSDKLSYVHSLVSKITSRGARVAFIRMPSDKWLWIIDQKQYPRQEFWDRFTADSRAATFHFKDYEELSGFNLPDGSHIDRRDKKQFTANLAQILNDSLFRE